MDAARKLVTRLDFQMSEEIAHCLAEMQDSIRAAGHARPTSRTLVSALIMAEARRGKELEDELLVPFRLTHSDAD